MLPFFWTLSFFVTVWQEWNSGVYLEILRDLKRSLEEDLDV